MNIVLALVLAAFAIAAGTLAAVLFGDALFRDDSLFYDARDRVWGFGFGFAASALVVALIVGAWMAYTQIPKGW